MISWRHNMQCRSGMRHKDRKHFRGMGMCLKYMKIGKWKTNNILEGSLGELVGSLLMKKLINHEDMNMKYSIKCKLKGATTATWTMTTYLDKMRCKKLGNPMWHMTM
jgi:hypothetical protein